LILSKLIEFFIVFIIGIPPATAASYDKASEFDYIYGWVDLLSKNKNLGRGVVFKSKKIFKSKEINKLKFSKKKYLAFIKGLIFMFCTRFNLINYLKIIKY